MKTYKEFITESAEPKLGKFAVKSQFGGWTDWKYNSEGGFGDFFAKKITKAIAKGASSKETAFTINTLYGSDGTKRSDSKAAFRITQVISNDTAMVELVPNYIKGHSAKVRTKGIVSGGKYYSGDNIPAELKKYF